MACANCPNCGDEDLPCCPQCAFGDDTDYFHLVGSWPTTGLCSKFNDPQLVNVKKLSQGQLCVWIASVTDDGFLYEVILTIWSANAPPVTLEYKITDIQIGGTVHVLYRGCGIYTTALYDCFGPLSQGLDFVLIDNTAGCINVPTVIKAQASVPQAPCISEFCCENRDWPITGTATFYGFTLSPFSDYLNNQSIPLDIKYAEETWTGGTIPCLGPTNTLCVPILRSPNDYPVSGGNIIIKRMGVGLGPPAGGTTCYLCAILADPLIAVVSDPTTPIFFKDCNAFFIRFNCRTNPGNNLGKCDITV